MLDIDNFRDCPAGFKKKFHQDVKHEPATTANSELKNGFGYTSTAWFAHPYPCDRSQENYESCEDGDIFFHDDFHESWATPSSHLFLFCMFHYKPSSYWDTPHFRKPPFTHQMANLNLNHPSIGVPPFVSTPLGPPTSRQRSSSLNTWRARLGSCRPGVQTQGDTNDPLNQQKLGFNMI